MTGAARSGAARRRPRLGFCGLGWIGRHRLQSIAAAGVADIAALADPDRQCRDDAQRIAPGARSVATLDELLAADLDGVVIATPNALHVEQVLAALAAGCAVFCQKPLARTAAETEWLVGAARDHDRDLDVDLSYRHVRAMQRVRDCVRSGDLGTVFAADLVFHNAYGPDKAWFYDRRLSGGGCVLDLGVHLVDLAMWTLDAPTVERVHSRLYAGGRPASAEDVEDFAAVQLELASGSMVRITCSWRISAGADAQIEASFYGTRGRATLRNVGGSFYDFVAERARGTALEVLSAGPDAWSGGAALAWVRRLAAGGGFVERDDLLQVARILDAVYLPLATPAVRPAMAPAAAPRVSRRDGGADMSIP